MSRTNGVTRNEPAADPSEATARGKQIPPDLVAFAAELSDAFQATPMARGAERLPGRRALHFTPEQLFARTVVPPTQRDAVDPSFGWFEEDCPVIRPDGIRFGSQVFWAPELIEFIEAPKHRARTFRIRYDRALLARGVLDQLVLVEVLPGGERVERVRCGRRDEVLQEIDFDAVLRHRAIYEAQLLARVAHARDVRRELESGTKALTDLRDARLAREAFQRTARFAPRVAEPMTFQSAAEAEAAATRDAQRALSSDIAKRRRGRRNQGTLDAPTGVAPLSVGQNAPATASEPLLPRGELAGAEMDAQRAHRDDVAATGDVASEREGAGEPRQLVPRTTMGGHVVRATAPQVAHAIDTAGTGAPTPESDEVTALPVSTAPLGAVDSTSADQSDVNRTREPEDDGSGARRPVDAKRYFGALRRGSPGR